MVALSVQFDYFLVKAFNILGLVSMYLANVAFTLYFHVKQRKEDFAFKHWYTEHKLMYSTTKYLMFFFNFKAIRLLYTQYFPPT